MFTVPDTNDAVATYPAFTGVGPIPGGFFADCNPAQNFPGTRPIAEHFNEQILNNHNLLIEAGVTGQKGDATMLARGVRGARFIRQSVNLVVAPGGTATPSNPFGGAPFDTVQNALAFLMYYRIARSATVAIIINAGTYENTTTIVPQHPDGDRIIIQGAGVGVTVLHFTGCTGIALPFSQLGWLRYLTIRGDGSSAANGIALTGFIGLDSVSIESFGVNGLAAVNGGVYGQGPISFKTNGGIGLYMIGGSICNFLNAQVVAQGNMTPTGANVSLWAGAQADFGNLTCTGGVRALSLGRGSGAQILQLNVSGATNAAQAVNCSGNSYLTASGAAAGAWVFAAGQTLEATANGFIFAGAALSGGTVTSPPVNTLGNQNGYISTVPILFAADMPAVDLLAGVVAPQPEDAPPAP